MTSLEIKRLDSASPTAQLRHQHSPFYQPAILHKQTKQQLSSSSNVNNNNSNINGEISISIIKSNSFDNTNKLSNHQMLNHNNNNSESGVCTASNNSSPFNTPPLKSDKNNDTLINDNYLDVDLKMNKSNCESTTSSNIDLKSLTFNRYGFVQMNQNTNSHLNDQPNYGTMNNENSNNLKEYLQTSDIDEFSEHLPIEVVRARETKWIEMLHSFDEWMSTKFSKIKSRCRKGIPQSMRSMAWMHLTGASILKKEKPNYYQDCLKNPNKIDVTKYIEDIKKDLHRQFPGHEMFMKKEGRDLLFNVLSAYAVHNREVGYCQAQGPIAAVLLMHMPEEDSFWMLVRISDSYLKSYFTPGLEKVFNFTFIFGFYSNYFTNFFCFKVQIDGKALFLLFKTKNYKAYSILKKQGVDPILYMTEWFMCIFARTLPWCCVLRVWDMFFCEGVKVLYKVALALMTNIFHDSSVIQRCSKQGMYETLSLLKNIPLKCLHEQKLVADAVAIKVHEKDLKNAFYKAEKDFKSSKSTNNENKNKKQLQQKSKKKE
jgi:hypothetical protein